MNDISVTVAIAGLVTTIELPRREWAETLRQRFGVFLSDGKPDWRLCVREDDSYGSTEPGWARHEGPVTNFHVFSYRGEIDLAAKTAWVTAVTCDRLASAVERVITYILMQTLPRERDALLLHACGVIFQGRGYVFFGHSGAGKTTVARLAQGHAEVLGDENIVLRLSAAGVELLSTPLWGVSTPPELVRRTNTSVPVARLFALAHADEFALAPLSPGQAITALLNTQKVATERVESAAAWLDVAGRIVRRVPVQTLSFPPMPELWSFLLRQEDNAVGSAELV